MTRSSVTAQAPAHATHTHHFTRDTHGRFLPEHAHRFPEHPPIREHTGEHAPPEKDFPETGTPEAILHRSGSTMDIGHSLKVTEAGHDVPGNGWLEIEQDDWLDKDAAR